MIERPLTLCANGRVMLPAYTSSIQLGYANNAGLYCLHVTLADEWEGMTVRAFWHLPGRTRPLTSLLVDGCTEVPALVTAISGQGSVTFEGSDGSCTVTSASVPYVVLRNDGTADPTLPEPKTPAWQQFLAKLLQELRNGGGISQTEKSLIFSLFESAAYTNQSPPTALTALRQLWSR